MTSVRLIFVTVERCVDVRRNSGNVAGGEIVTDLFLRNGSIMDEKNHGLLAAQS